MARATAGALLKKRFSGRGRPRFSRKVSPSYSRRKRPRRCSSGTTRISGVPTMARPPSWRDLRQLADREIVAPAAFDDPLPAAHAGVALRNLGQRAVEIEA